MVRRVLLVLVAVLATVFPGTPAAIAAESTATQAEAATVIGEGEFVGFVKVDCEEVGQTIEVECSVAMASILCAEEVVTTGVSRSCRVTMSGTATGLGTKQACAAFGGGSGSVSSISGSRSHSGTITLGGSGGAYEGSGDAGGTMVFVEMSWASAGCTDLADGLVRGTYTVTLSP